MQRVPFQKLYDEFYRCLIQTGFTPERAELCARIFAENTRDGVHSHGLNRFPQFIERAKKGRRIDIHATPEKATHHFRCHKAQAGGRDRLASSRDRPSPDTGRQKRTVRALPDHNAG